MNDRILGPVDRMLGLVTPMLFAAGLALAGVVSILALYAFGSTEWLLAYGVATILALALPVAFMAWHDRWQIRRSVHRAVPDTTTKVLSGACRVFSVLLMLSAVLICLLCGWFGLVSWRSGMLASSGYFALVGVAVLAQPLAFMHFHDRWGQRNGLPD